MDRKHNSKELIDRAKICNMVLLKICNRSVCVERSVFPDRKDLQISFGHQKICLYPGMSVGILAVWKKQIFQRKQIFYRSLGEPSCRSLRWTTLLADLWPALATDLFISFNYLLASGLSIGWDVTSLVVELQFVCIGLVFLFLLVLCVACLAVFCCWIFCVP